MIVCDLNSYRIRKMNELYPGSCPFCGGARVFFGRFMNMAGKDGGYQGAVEITCGDCGKKYVCECGVTIYDYATETGN